LDLHGKPMSTASYDHQSAAKQRQQPPRLRSAFPIQEGPSIRCMAAEFPPALSALSARGLVEDDERP
ncbi:hypothetical protein KC322_g3638, partial [Hortaea werneckii]